MPVITFDKEHLDEGFMFLARRGEVGCLPNDVFVITDVLFELLQKSHIGQLAHQHFLAVHTACEQSVA